MEKPNKLLTIGQFAALHGINKKTLMWYDEIDLFHPAKTDPENGYRYYSYAQSSVLETILLLRELDVPTEEIRSFLRGRSPATLRLLLREQIGHVDRELAHLRAVRGALSQQLQNIETLLTMDLSEIRMLEKKERRVVTVDITPEMTFDRQVELITAETAKYGLRRLHDASYGTMISVERLMHGDFAAYSKLFIEIPFRVRRAGLHVQPAGCYLRAFYQDTASNGARCYRRLLSFAASRGLVPFGFSYERILNETVIERTEDAIVQIDVPVRPTEAL